MNQLKLVVASLFSTQLLFACSNNPDSVETAQPSGALASGVLDGNPALDIRRDRGKIHAVSAKGDVLVADDPSAPPNQRARRFLASHGQVIGLSANERQSLPLVDGAVMTDAVG